ncbi:MAG: winged helix-turn-helix transcriptional regulator [Nitrosopumilus sp.]|nr:winged helix-turn-helix transcriptional regulator [Nitrosopumilus sp.]
MNDASTGNSAKILEYISENPGCHLRQIKRELSLAMGTLQYHLNLLEKQGRVLSEKQNLHKYYFPIGLFEKNEKSILKILNQETAREILLSILEKKNPTQTDIANFMQLSSPSINWHIKRLMELGLIVENKDGKFKRYSFGIDTKYIVSLMKSYHPNIWNRWSNRLAEMFLSMSQEGDN